jgi:hypothetical protein
MRRLFEIGDIHILVNLLRNAYSSLDPVKIGGVVQGEALLS